MASIFSINISTLFLCLFHQTFQISFNKGIKLCKSGIELCKLGEPPSLIFIFRNRSPLERNVVRRIHAEFHERKKNSESNISVNYRNGISFINSNSNYTKQNHTSSRYPKN